MIKNFIFIMILFIPFLVLLLLLATPKYSIKDTQNGGGSNNKIMMNYKYLLLIGIIGFSSLVYKLFI
tara:strand:+ start:396 stop:596 length:201 start_codon:yes stop_codon:yes gene_type:complete